MRFKTNSCRFSVQLGQHVVQKQHRILAGFCFKFISPFSQLYGQRRRPGLALGNEGRGRIARSMLISQIVAPWAW